MLRARNEYPKVRTPKGTGIWPAINEPDYKYNKHGEFHFRLALDDPDSPELLEIVKKAEEIRDEAYEAEVAELRKKNKPGLIKKVVKADILKVEEDPQTGDPTGRVILRAGLQHKVEIKNGPKAGTVFFKTPDVFDARGKRLRFFSDNGSPLKGTPKVGGGTEAKLNVTIMDYRKPGEDNRVVIGAKFELNAIQIIKLVSGGQRNADDYGFGEEDGDSIDFEDTGGFEDEGAGFEGGDGDGDADF